MGLLRYEADFSQLTIHEKNLAAKELDRISNDGLIWKSDFQVAELFVENGVDVTRLNLPPACHLRQIP